MSPQIHPPPSVLLVTVGQYPPACLHPNGVTTARQAAAAPRVKLRVQRGEEGSARVSSTRRGTGERAWARTRLLGMPAELGRSAEDEQELAGDERGRALKPPRQDAAGTGPCAYGFDCYPPLQSAFDLSIQEPFHHRNAAACVNPAAVASAFPGTQGHFC